MGLTELLGWCLSPIQYHHNTWVPIWCIAICKYCDSILQFIAIFEMELTLFLLSFNVMPHAMCMILMCFSLILCLLTVWNKDLKTFMHFKKTIKKSKTKNCDIREVFFYPTPGFPHIKKVISFSFQGLPRPNCLKFKNPTWHGQG